MHIQLSFIILSWNSGKYLSSCFEAIISKCRAEGIGFEILVVDNGSTDDSAAILRDYHTRYPNSLKPIFLPKNFGTTYPRNLALRQAAGRYLCICDSDTELVSGSIRDLLSFLDHDERIAIVAPQLFLDDGTIQNSVKKFPTFLCKILKIPKAILRINMPDMDFYADFPFAIETEVDTAISACWFFKQELLAEVGFLDEKIFYAPEDLDYCLRIRKAGKKIVYFPHLKVLHHTQQVSHKVPLSRISFCHFMGLLYYFKKHGGWISTKHLLVNKTERSD